MTYELITRFDSRNFTPAASVPAVYGRPRTIDSITIHWWGLPEWNATFDGTVAFLCTNNKPTSAHEVIEAGKVAVIVAHGDASWAAGNAVGNATSIHLECNPRASDADYETVAERIRDIRAMHGKDLPLIPHRDWQATMCPGVWDLARLDLMSRQGSAAFAPLGTTTTLEEDDMSAEDIQYLKEKAHRAEQLLLSFQAVLTDPVSGYIGKAAMLTLSGGNPSLYIKGKDEATIYAHNIETGELRGLTKDEWAVIHAAGGKFIDMEQKLVNDLLKLAAKGSN